MQSSSSRIPRRLSREEQDSFSPNTEVEEGKQETARKLSLTDQGKAAKFLRKRLAVALATNTKLTSDSSNSESDQEMTGKELKARKERKTSIPRKISQETNSPQAQHLPDATTNEGLTGDRRRKLNIATQFSLRNGMGNVEQGNNSAMNLMSQKETSRIYSFASDTNETVTNDNTAARPSRAPPSHDELLPTIHEKATTKSEDDTSANRYGTSFDVIESEVIKLKLDVNQTLEDFQDLNAATERVKRKLEELRRERIRFAN